MSCGEWCNSIMNSRVESTAKMCCWVASGDEQLCGRRLKNHNEITGYALINDFRVGYAMFCHVDEVVSWMFNKKPNYLSENLSCATF